MSTPRPRNVDTDLPPNHDVVAVGNALVDVLSNESEELLGLLDLVKGTMAMVDQDLSDSIYAALSPGVESSGGSAANTVAGVASFGGRAAFVGRIGDDQFGQVFSHDLAALGIAFDGPRAKGDGPTGRCLVIVTPDADRTMCTFLGVASELSPDDLPVDLIDDAYFTYLEGYLWDQPSAKEAFRAAAARAHQAGRKVALTLSDPFCVDRHRADFLDLISGEIDILFANDDELRSLYEVDDFDTALQKVRNHCEIAAVTRGPQGSMIVAGDDVYEVAAHPVDAVVDTTGAGDLYAAGFLFALARGYDPVTAGKLGGLAASEVISHMGARPEVDLSDLAASVLG
ncbi:MAG: adenosine kinase [Acidimicrobiia bacterium]